MDGGQPFVEVRVARSVVAELANWSPHAQVRLVQGADDIWRMELRITDEGRIADQLKTRTDRLMDAQHLGASGTLDAEEIERVLPSWPEPLELPEEDTAVLRRQASGSLEQRADVSFGAYEAVNLREGLRVLPDTGDWHGWLRMQLEGILQVMRAHGVHVPLPNSKAEEQRARIRQRQPRGPDPVPPAPPRPDGRPG